MATAHKNLGSSVHDVILMISRTNVKTMIREEFKKIGQCNFLVADSVAQIEKILAQYKDAPTVIDWEIGQIETVKVLSLMCRPGEISFRPVMITCIALTEMVVGTAAEYDVQRIHSGELTRTKIGPHVEALLFDKVLPLPIRQGLQRVMLLRQQGDWKQSISILQNLGRDFPDNPRVAAELVENFIHLDQWDDAASLAKQLADAEPGYPRALGLYGRVLMKQRRFPEAIEVFKRANILNPMNVDRLVSLAQALLKIDRITDARIEFNAVLKLDQSSRDANLGLGECALLEGDVNEALDYMRDVSSPRERAAMFNSAAILSMRQGRYEIGKKLYQVAIRSVGEDMFLLSRLVYNLGIGYYRWQREFDALECFEKAASIDVHYADAIANVRTLARRLKTSSKFPTAHSNEKSNKPTDADKPKGDFNEQEFEAETISK
jgi:tetratricopeptide (TPR) repeat protein